MSGPLEISLNEKLLFIESLLIPAFDPDNELDSSKKRKEWIATQSEEKKWGSEVALKLIETDGAVENLAEAKAAGAKVERSLERQQGADGGVGESQQALLDYMRTHAPPAYYGCVYELPNGLQFPFWSADTTENKMIIRNCYERVRAIVGKQFERSGHRGVLFSGSQGNGKTWCSLYVVWHFLSLHQCVVYEVAAESAFYVIRPNGVVSYLKGPATKVDVLELRSKDTIHVFDAKAHNVREPVHSEAFLVVFKSRSQRSFTQMLRLPNVLHCCIPSYELYELEQACGIFGVTADEVRRRVEEIGPSIRHILVNDYDRCKWYVQELARGVKPEQLDLYIRDGSAVDDASEEIAGCLLKVCVDESRFADPLDAYQESNVKWELASPKLCAIVVANTGTFPSAASSRW